MKTENITDIWRFPKFSFWVPQNKSGLLSDFPWNKPSSDKGDLPSTPICFCCSTPSGFHAQVAFGSAADLEIHLCTSKEGSGHVGSSGGWLICCVIQEAIYIGFTHETLWFSIVMLVYQRVFLDHLWYTRCQETWYDTSWVDMIWCENWHDTIWCNMI